MPCHHTSRVGTRHTLLQSQVHTLRADLHTPASLDSPGNWNGLCCSCSIDLYINIVYCTVSSPGLGLALAWFRRRVEDLVRHQWLSPGHWWWGYSQGAYLSNAALTWKHLPRSLSEQLAGLFENHTNEGGKKPFRVSPLFYENSRDQ